MTTGSVPGGEFREDAASWAVVRGPVDRRAMPPFADRGEPGVYAGAARKLSFQGGGRRAGESESYSSHC